MFVRLFISLLLITSLSTITLGRQSVYQEEPADQPKEEALTLEEKREARLFAEHIIERLGESEDITTIVKEFFVADFTGRLRGNMNDIVPLSATPEVAAQLTSDEILRAYSASINCIYLASVHYLEILRKRANEKAQRGEAIDSDDEEKFTIEELIPLKLIQLIQSDPALARILAAELKKEASERDFATADDENSDPASLEEFMPFKSVEKMRHYTSLLEQGVILLREHVNSFSTEEKPSVREGWLKLMSGSSDKKSDVERDTINPRLQISSDEFMGYPAGTRMICTNILMFHMDMIRGADGRFKIVNIYLMGN